MKVLYFAWLRERLNLSEEEIAPPPEVVTVRDLIQWLRSRNEAAELAMEKPELVRWTRASSTTTPPCRARQSSRCSRR